jgi:ABC-type transport system substrate-binding protein
MTSHKSWVGIYAGRSLSRRKFLAGAAATGAGAAALIACGGSSSGGFKFEAADSARQPGKVWFATNDWKLPDETKDAVKGGVYPGVMDSEQATSYDALISAPSQVPHSTHVNEYMMAKRRAPGLDPASVEAAVPQPMLAQSMETAGDGTQYTFTLRPGVKFHPIAPVNGRVMDIEDWRTSLDRFLELSPQRAFLRDLLDKVEYPDSTHMVMKLKQPFAPFEDLIWSERFAFQIVPKELNRDPKLAAEKAIGTGFKVLDKHQPSVTMEYRKHADYWGGDPFIDRWHYPLIPEYANRMAQFVAGNTIEFTPQSRDVIQLARDVPGAAIIGGELMLERIRRMNFGAYEKDSRPYKDARVRIAIRRAINFTGIGEVLSNRKQLSDNGIEIEMLPTTHATRSPVWWLNPEKGDLGALSANYLYDVAEAKKLTAAAGFTSALPEFNWMYNASSGSTPQEDQLMIDSINQSGVFKVAAVGQANTVQERNCRSLRQCDALIRTGNSEYDMDYFFREQTFGARDGGDPSYPNPELNRLAEAFRKEIDFERRVQIVKDYQKVQAEYMSMIPATHEYTVFTFRYPYLHNVGNGDAEGYPYLGGHQQWLDPKMPRRNG